MARYALVLACLSLLDCRITEELLDPDEQDAFDRGSDPTVAAQMMTTMADSMFNFDPTINPANDAMTNAMAIQTQLKGEACGTITLAGTTITADFGAGCTFKNGT